MDFWDVVWFIIISFAFVAYLMVMFTILTDLFRDRDTSGWMKAVWVVCLIFLPLLTSLVYLIARGKGMTERSMRDAAEMRAQQDAYIREVAGGNGQSPADQIAKAREMLDAGVITQPEYERLKEKALV
jgi:hypothetical protein